MKSEEFKARTKRFAVLTIKFLETLPRNQTIGTLSNQLLRSSTSVGANYRAACRARSQADFISKMGIVEEETDESLYWMEILVEAGFVSSNQITVLVSEAKELLAMVVASIKTAKSNRL
jgi:four helix bundle protein